MKRKALAGIAFAFVLAFAMAMVGCSGGSSSSAASASGSASASSASASSASGSSAAATNLAPISVSYLNKAGYEDIIVADHEGFYGTNVTLLPGTTSAPAAGRCSITLPFSTFSSWR